MAKALEERRKGLEEDYFYRKEQETLANMRSQRTGEGVLLPPTVAELHCPRCGTVALEEVSLEAITADRCPTCQGIWLDAGELEQLTTKDRQGWFARLWRSPSTSC